MPIIRAGDLVLEVNRVVVSPNTIDKVSWRMKLSLYIKKKHTSQIRLQLFKGWIALSTW